MMATPRAPASMTWPNRRAGRRRLRLQGTCRRYLSRRHRQPGWRVPRPTSTRDGSTPTWPARCRRPPVVTSSRQRCRRGRAGRDAYRVGRDVKGTVALLTLGTGIGSALFLQGQLVPNTELGHLEIDGHDAETKRADSAREREGLTWSTGRTECRGTSSTSRRCRGLT